MHLLSRNALTWALTLCLIAFILTARWAVVGRFGMDLPFWDQWDAEGLRMLLPWFTGQPLAPGLFAPHNEHYVVLTKLLNLGLTLATGQWDQRVQCVVNAALPAAIAVACLRWSVRFAPITFVSAFGVFLAIAWGLPWATQNVLSGFHSQQIFLIGFSFVTIAFLPFARSWSVTWWIGALSAILVLGSMGSGLLAGAAVLGLLLAQLCKREISFRSCWPAATVALATFVFGWLTRQHVPGHDMLKAATLLDFFTTVARAACWPASIARWSAIIIWLPWLVISFWLMLSSKPSDTRRHAWTIVGLGMWVWAQILATAYARGAGGPGPASRYIDTLIFGLTINALAIGWLWRHSASTRKIRLALTSLAIPWIAVAGCGGWFETERVSHELDFARSVYGNAIRHTRAYLGSGDIADLSHPHIPYPGADSFAARLSYPELVRLLPVSVQPNEIRADSPAARAGFTGVPHQSPLSRVAELVCKAAPFLALLSFFGLILSAAVLYFARDRHCKPMAS